VHVRGIRAHGQLCLRTIMGRHKAGPYVRSRIYVVRGHNSWAVSSGSDCKGCPCACTRCSWSLPRLDTRHNFGNEPLSIEEDLPFGHVAEGASNRVGHCNRISCFGHPDSAILNTGARARSGLVAMLIGVLPERVARSSRRALFPAILGRGVSGLKLEDRLPLQYNQARGMLSTARAMSSVGLPGLGWGLLTPTPQPGLSPSAPTLIPWPAAHSAGRAVLLIRLL
jgi:hypothetical protein